MSNKIELITKTVDGVTNDYVIYDCPGCKGRHCIPVEKDKRANHWAFNYDLKSPTLTPSVHEYKRLTVGGEKTICHHFVRNGKIEYCGDCPHSMAGQKVDMSPIG